MTIWHIQNNICIITMCYCPNLSLIQECIYGYSHSLILPRSLSLSLHPRTSRTFSDIDTFIFIFLLYLIVLHHLRPHQRSTNSVFPQSHSRVVRHQEKHTYTHPKNETFFFFLFYHLSQIPSSNRVIS